jgi:tRNA(adenine34) deaminase
MNVDDHHGFMQQALDLARQALADREFPVGCVLVSKGRVVASGKRMGTRKEQPSELDHAEMIALRKWEAAGRPGGEGPLSLYCTMEPCLMCYGALLISGINTIIYAYEDAMGGGCTCDIAQLPPLYRESGARLVTGICRTESLDLFKIFFSDPSVGYWHDSKLARYTLLQ